MKNIFLRFSLLLCIPLVAALLSAQPAGAACSFLCNDGSGNGTFGNNLTVTGTLYTSGITPTGQILAGDGTAAAPSYSFSNSAGTGIYRAGTDILGFSTAGTLRAQINASGNVGIGIAPYPWGQLTSIDLYGLSGGGSVSGAFKNLYGMGNLYFNGSSYVYKETGSGAILAFGDNAGTPQFYFATAPNGTAGTSPTMRQQFEVAHTASAVNYASVTGAATGAGPALSVKGSDTNINLILTPKGTGALGVKNTPNTWAAAHDAIQIGSGSNTAVVGGAGLRTVFYNNTYFDGGQKAVNTGFSQAYLMESDGSHIFYSAPSTTSGSGAAITKQFQIGLTASSVNYLQATGGAAGSGATLNALGTDATVDINLSPKTNGTAGIVNINAGPTTNAVTNHQLRIYANTTGGTFAGIKFNTNEGATSPAGYISMSSNSGGFWFVSPRNLDGWGFNFTDTGGTSNPIFKINTGSGGNVNYLQVNGGTTGNGPSIQTLGTDSNIPLTITPKGTGAINLAQHVVFTGPTAPTMGACGTSPSVAGRDGAMLITVGTGGVATSCAVTFGQAWATAPVCNVNSDTDAAGLTVTTTTTTVTIGKTTAFTASSKLHVQCMGY